jgi:hypothetical protein
MLIILIVMGKYLPITIFFYTLLIMAMKINNMKNQKVILLALFAILAFDVNAQKLPTIQQISLRIPDNSKIDGKVTEWNYKFQAYNKNVNLFYTIANDDNNLYLALKATEVNIIYKIINGGITFTLNPSMTKKVTGTVITYPLFGKKNLPILNLKDKPILKKDSTINSKQLDSFKYALNKQLIDKSKEIKISGVKQITDSLISVYNEYKIKTAQLFDDKIAYTYELSIPLRYLGLDINNLKKFMYNIKINGIYSSLPPNANVVLIVVSDNSMNAMTPTDFWAEYTLIKN